MNITLKHPHKQDVDISVSATNNDWLKCVVVVRNFPHSLIGFKHPEAAAVEDFTLHYVHSFLIGLSLQPMESGAVAVNHRHHPLAIPLDGILPANIIISGPHIMTLVEMQPAEYQEMIRAILLNTFDPPKVELVREVPKIYEK